MNFKNKIIFTSLVLFILTAYPTEGQSIVDKVKEREAVLQQTLQEKESEVKELKVQLDEQTSNRKTLQGEINRINGEISIKENSIRKYTSVIGQLSDNIKSGEVKIKTLEQELEAQKQHMSQLYRKLNEIDAFPPILKTVSEESLSTFLSNFEDQKSIQLAIADSFNEIRGIQKETETEIIKLSSNIQETEELKQLEVVETRQIVDNKKDKDRLLNVTKGLESAYQKVISDKESEISRIKAELFELRGSTAISFGEALEYAFDAQKVTGVRPAFLLGIIKIETELGNNLGTGRWDRDMHPIRDVPVYKVIVQTLGLNRDNLPVSRKPSYGWGGAMGPAQFIPSTWACYGGYINEKTNSCSSAPRRNVISSTLDIGDSGRDVYNLQRFLNRNGFTIATSGEGSPGNEGTYYGPATARAVTKLQERFRSVLLEPDGLSRGTGGVGPRTKYFIDRYEIWTSGWHYDASKDRIRKMLNLSSPSNPWNPKEAFTASAVYLKELGADKGTEASECMAARRYLAGSNHNSSVAWGYCRTVQGFTRDFQSKIDFIQ